MKTTPALLITQCLQNDFAEPLDRYETLPNQLHIGYSEARRLMGEIPEEGPVHTVMEWAYAQKKETLEIIHIRDWHDPKSPEEKQHLDQFGSHCVQDSVGAGFVFQNAITDNNRHHIVHASGLNDFVDTNLEEILNPWKNQSIKVGLLGVWTEAKISFLAYELATRYPSFEIALCSALTASSSRMNHFIAIEQLQGILGVRVFSSVATFTEFLTGSHPMLQERIRNARIRNARIRNARVDVSKLMLPADHKISDTDQELLLYLFRNSKEVSLKVLDGGFSGNVVLRASAHDIYGHAQVPQVIKIGDRDLIAGERSSFERIQEVLGNSAPGIVDFAEIRDRGAIKYRYAGMLDGNLSSFQRLYGKADGVAIDRVLDIVFKEQLGRFYDAATQETLNLLEYYDFKSKYAVGVKRRVLELFPGADPEAERLQFLDDVDIPNVIGFYEKDLLTLKESYASPRYVSYLHGDLNGANILIDASNNVWLIDFFHTHRGHILKDLIKLENDILFIFTSVDSEEELREAMRLTDLLFEHGDLGVPPDKNTNHGFKFPQFQRAWQVVCKLRSFYPDLIEMDRDPYQLYCGIVRYAMHTLSFDESNVWQRKWALYAGSHASLKVKKSLQFSERLRVDEIPLQKMKGKLGLTILPGRKDRSRDLEKDLQTLKELNYMHIVCFLTENEFESYGVGGLKASYANQDFHVEYFPIPDQGVPPTGSALDDLLSWVHKNLESGHNTMLHCVGGLGRSGMISALYLKKFHGYKGQVAIEHIRQHRSIRAIETRSQYDFVVTN